jgi:hypothetical protein
MYRFLEVFLIVRLRVEQLHEEGEVYNDRSWVAFVEDENGKEVA